MRAHRSHELIAVDDCLIAAEGAPPRRCRRRRCAAGRGGPRARPRPRQHDVTVGSSTHPFSVASDGFWQVHPGAPQVLVGTVLDLLDPQPGERALDLYAGVGLFAAFLAEATGARVVAPWRATAPPASTPGPTWRR